MTLRSGAELLSFPGDDCSSVVLLRLNGDGDPAFRLAPLDLCLGGIGLDTSFCWARMSSEIVSLWAFCACPALTHSSIGNAFGDPSTTMVFPRLLGFTFRELSAEMTSSGGAMSVELSALAVTVADCGCSVDIVSSSSSDDAMVASWIISKLFEKCSL